LPKPASTVMDLGCVVRKMWESIPVFTDGR